MTEWFERGWEKRMIKQAAGMITIGDGLADWYAQRLDIERPVVVRNCRYYQRARI